MESLTLGVLFIYLTISFTQSACFSHAQGHLGVSALKKFAFIDVAWHQVTKRETNGALSDQDAADCNSIFIDYICSSGIAKRFIDIELSCEVTIEEVRSIADDCARSESGDFCGTAYQQFYVQFQNQRRSLLMTCSGAVASNICPSTCYNFLNDFRSKLGCCINTYNNTYLWQVFVDYRLWNLCGVPLPATHCRNRLPLITPANTRNCTLDELFDLEYNQYICLPSVGQPYINALLKNSKCYHTAEFIVTVCLVNADGVPCSSLLADNRYVNIESLNSMCVSSNISCSSTCRSGINEAKEAVGCCVNRYNTSLCSLIL